MTEEEKKLIKDIINEHKKFLSEFIRVKKDEIAELQNLIDTNANFGRAQQNGLFPHNFKKLSKEARHELAVKSDEEFNRHLYSSATKTADSHERTAEEILEDNGYLNEKYADVVLLKNESYDSALIGISDDNRAVYSFDKMIDWYVEKNGCSVDDAIEWIECNTIRALPYMEARAPIIVHEFDM